MFKAIRASNGAEIVILENDWQERIDSLRGLDRADELICQGCGQPVRVKAGDIRLWHFAHKSKGSCRYQTVRADLLNARLLLYGFLKGKFSERASIEHEPPGSRLKRPVDCWVDTEQGCFAFWIVEKNMCPKSRRALVREMKRRAEYTWWIFLERGRQEIPRASGAALQLSTTERELLVSTRYDHDAHGTGAVERGTLHYLDPDRQALTTYRNLRMLHGPQVYAGRKMVTEFSSLLVHGDNGELVHAGEFEARKAAEHRREALEQKYQQVWGSKIQGPCHGPRKVPQNRERPACMFCGIQTSQWWSFDGNTNTCKCNRCAQKGIYSKPQRTENLARKYRPMATV